MLFFTKTSTLRIICGDGGFKLLVAVAVVVLIVLFRGIKIRKEPLDPTQVIDAQTSVLYLLDGKGRVDFRLNLSKIGETVMFKMEGKRC